MLVKIKVWGQILNSKLIVDNSDESKIYETNAQLGNGRRSDCLEIY